MVRARRTDSGTEFDLDADHFLHGLYSRRIGLAKNDCPTADLNHWHSWMAGYDTKPAPSGSSGEKS